MSQDNTPMLTEQEKRILKQVSLGMTNQQIARMFEIKERTVEYHLGEIFKKLNVTSRTAAAMKAEQMGILNGP